MTNMTITTMWIASCARKDNDV